jgi:oleate hydratase
MDRCQYTLYESVILPITNWLRKEGVEFHFNSRVTDLRMDKETDPTTITEILLQDDERVKKFEVKPSDIVVVTIGSTNSGLQLGDDSTPPSLPSHSDQLVNSDWSLWIKLAQKSEKFGHPLSFNAHIQQSQLEAFTTTLYGPEFSLLYERLTNDEPGSGALLSLANSNWSLSISFPHQPVCSNQPLGVQVIWGYSLNPEKRGNYVEKQMLQCTGKEIMIELLHHLKFPVETVLPTTNTIPCHFPLATSPLLPRAYHNRPEVIPPKTTNIAIVGQFAEIPEDTTFNMEYSVRSAQTAVYRLMDINKRPPKSKRNLLLGVLNILHVV